MARPIKRGLDYFPFDVDFFTDPKIRILRSRYGADGVTLYMYLICEIYRNGYYLKADDDFLYLVADELRMDINKVRQVLNFLLERSLFSKTLFQSDKVITSTGIQKRFQTAVKERAKKTPINIKDYWLLDESETESFLKVNPNSDNSTKNDSNSTKNDSNSTTNDIKERKEKKSIYRSPRNKNSFNNFKEREYTSSQIEELEQKLLGVSE